MSSSMWPSASMIGWPACRRTSALDVTSLLLWCSQQLAEDLVQPRRDLLGDDLVRPVDVVARNDDQRDVGQAQDLGVGAGGRFERLGDKGHRWYSPLFQMDGVEQTARGARASFGEAVDHTLVAGEAVEDVSFGRSRQHRLDFAGVLGSGGAFAEQTLEHTGVAGEMRTGEVLLLVAEEPDPRHGGAVAG